MPTVTIYPVKFIDSPAKKTVTAIMSDDSEIIIQAMSNGNYTNPPGYNDTTTDENIIRTRLKDRANEYKLNLVSQLNN